VGGRRKLGVWIACLLALVPVGVALVLASTKAKPANVVVPGDTVILELGDQPNGQQIDEVFFVRNPGATPLHVLSINRSCGCTVTTELPDHIAPGQQAPMGFKVTTEGRSRSIEVSAVIRFAGQPPARVGVKAGLVDRLPSSVAFGVVRRGDPALHHIEVRPAIAGEKPQIANLAFDRRYFAISAHSPDAELLHPTIDLELQRDIPPGGFSKTLQVTLTIGNKKQVSNVDLAGWVQRDLEVEPANVNFGMTGSNLASTQTVRLYSPYGQEVHFERIDSDSTDAVQVVASRYTADGKSCELDLSINADAIRGLQVFQTNLVATVDGAEHVIPLECYAGRIAPN